MDKPATVACLKDPTKSVPANKRHSQVTRHYLVLDVIREVNTVILRVAN
jgi:hypothetical protein